MALTDLAVDPHDVTLVDASTLGAPVGIRLALGRQMSKAP